MICPDVETYYESSIEDPWSYIWIGFSGIKARECISNCGFSDDKPVISCRCTDQLRDCVEQLIDAHQLTYANELKRSGLMMQFLSLLIEDQAAMKPEQTNYDYSGAIYVKHAITYLSQNYARKIKITELADYIGVNRSYLTNSFKKAMNMSPQEFLVNLRMDKAVSLLQNTTLPINTIAVQVGYDDSLAFSKIFKKKYGISPRQYRETPVEVIRADAKGGYPGEDSL